MIFDIANLTALCNIIDDQEMVKPNQILAGLYLCAYGYRVWFMCLVLPSGSSHRVWSEKGVHNFVVSDEHSTLIFSC